MMIKDNYATLLRQVRILEPLSNTDKIADVLIAEGKIKAIAEKIVELPEETKVMEGEGLILAPGLVDLYSHSGEPGNEERETLLSLMTAGATGGFTRIVILPDTKPCLDHVSVIKSLDRQEKELHQNNPVLSHLMFWGALTEGVKGQNMTELVELSKEVIGFADGYPLNNLGLLRRLLEYLQPLQKPIALWANDTALASNGVMREGVNSTRFGLPSNPALSETVAMASILELVAITKTPVHLMRVSTRRGVELIAEAKAKGLPITASTTWLHLLLDTEAIASYDPCLRIDPPLGIPDDLLALRAGVKQGVIDAIAVDHTPYTYEEKTLAFGDAPPGAIGLELALPLLWQNFVVSGEWTALQLWKLLSLAPQLCLGEPPLSCQEGQRAELLLYNPQERWTVNHHTLKSLSNNTSWFGKELTGRVIRIWN